MALVLYYHRVGPAGASHKMNVPPEVFRHQLGVLARRHRFVTLDEVVDRAPRDAASVTFDDGYRDVIEHALPILKEFGIPATLFVVAGAAGGRDAWYRGEHAIATWEDLARWRDAGMALGSHALTHRRLDAMAPEEARREVVESKRLIEEKLGTPVAHFAYPQGGRTPELERALVDAGYRAAWGTKSGSDAPYARRRIRVSANDRGFRWRFKLWKIRWGLY